MTVKRVLTEGKNPVKIWTNDIEEVMGNQSDLVEVVAQLKQILCIKG